MQSDEIIGNLKKKHRYTWYYALINIITLHKQTKTNKCLVCQVEYPCKTLRLIIWQVI